MAQIARKSNDLAEKYIQAKRLMIVGYAVCALCFVLFAATMMCFNFSLSIPLMMGFLGGGLLGGYMTRKVSALHSGIMGEAATASIVSSLPDCYCGFQNLKVTYDNKISELDMVVVGPTGVFVIETKNMNGNVMGNYDGAQWVQHKVGEGGTPYSKSFYNPVKQVSTHVYRLANFLRSNGINVYVNSMVYFSNPETFLQVNGAESGTPVFSALGNGDSQIRRYITEHNSTMSEEDFIKTVTLLNKI